MELLSKRSPWWPSGCSVHKAFRARSFHKAAEAILTTDTVAKIAHASVRVGGREVKIWGCAKGRDDSSRHDSFRDPSSTASPRGEGRVRGSTPQCWRFFSPILRANSRWLTPLLAASTER